jgi:hypothetical protein
MDKAIAKHIAEINIRLETIEAKINLLVFKKQTADALGTIIRDEDEILGDRKVRSYE